MQTFWKSITGGIVLIMAVGAAGCVPIAAPAAPAQSASPRVFFVDLEDGATVSAPLMVKMGAENFTVEPAGEVKEGAGHMHIMVDAACVDAGQGVPKDDTHLHYGKAQMEAELALTPGDHTLCLQAADGLHIALAGEGMTQVIKVTVQ